MAAAGQCLPGVTRGHEQCDGEPSADRVADHGYRSYAQALAGAEPAPRGQHIVDGGVLDRTPEGRGTDWMPQLAYPPS